MKHIKIVAIHRGSQFRLGKVKFRGSVITSPDGSWTYRPNEIIPIEDLTASQIVEIIKCYKETLLEEMEFQIFKDKTLEVNRSKWMEDIEKVTFEDVYRNAEQH